MNQEEIDAVMKLFVAGKTQKEIADELGLSIDQVKRRVKAGRDGKPETASTGYKLGGDEKDRKILMQADEIARLKSEIKNQHRANIEAEHINEILGTLVNANLEPPAWLISPSKRGNTKEVLMTSWADWHIGETVFKNEVNGINEYSKRIVEARVKRLVERTIDLAQNYGPGQYPGAVINILGDMVSGYLHEEHRKTDWAPPLECALFAVELLVWGLRKMADTFGQIYVPCVCGNHGRMTVKPEFKNYVKKNWDYLVYKMLEREFANDKRIIIDVRESNEVYYNVYGTTYLALHGDMISKGGTDSIIGSLGPITRGEIKTRGRMATTGIPYDMMLIGHYHQPFWLPRVIASGTLKGYCEYSKNALNAPPIPPTQPLWFHHPKYGITSRWEIMVDDPVKIETAKWISIFDPLKV